eukprot:scaffold90676_cov17-Prasinocladus_malaysianus.AAC.1
MQRLTYDHASCECTADGQVRGVDSSGEAVTAPEPAEWTVDASGPTVDITAGPGLLTVTANSSATFDFQVRTSDRS